MITVTHIISVLLGMVTKEGQNVTWISDADDMFATELHRRDCARMMGTFSSRSDGCSALIGARLHTLIWTITSTSSLFDSTVAPLRLAANCSIVWPNRPCRQTRPRLQPWSNHNLLRSVASSKYQ